METLSDTFLMEACKYAIKLNLDPDFIHILDEQSSTRWSKVPLSSGTQTFTWHLTARHATAKWHYYVTKPNWNPNEPLTRDQFELIPFYGTI
nr:lytic polysaccharide monooxygenase [Halalkalibacterium halodurans]